MGLQTDWATVPAIYKRRDGVTFEKAALEKLLPSAPKHNVERKKLWKELDNNGNNSVSLAEFDSWFNKHFGAAEVKMNLSLINGQSALYRYAKPVFVRAFNLANGVSAVPSKGGADYITFDEFRLLMVATQIGLLIYRLFDIADESDDLRVTKDEWDNQLDSINQQLVDFGYTGREVTGNDFYHIDTDGGGMILLNEAVVFFLAKFTDNAALNNENTKEGAGVHRAAKPPKIKPNVEKREVISREDRQRAVEEKRVALEAQRQGKVALIGTPVKSPQKAAERMQKYMNHTGDYSSLSDFVVTTNQDQSSWLDWQVDLYNEVKNLLDAETKSHLASVSQSRLKMESLLEHEWKDPESGAMKLDETPRAVLGYLPKTELQRLNDIILDAYSTEINRLRALITDNQTKMRCSEPDRDEVGELLAGETFFWQDVADHRVVSDHWEDLAAIKVPIIDTLKEREEFLQECEDFEMRSTGDGGRYKKESTLKVNDENKFRAHAYKKIKEQDSDAIAACRKYMDETQRLFEIDGVNYLEMIKEQKFGRTEGHSTLLKLPPTRIPRAAKLKFSNKKPSNLIPDSVGVEGEHGDYTTQASKLRVSLYEIGIETNNLITNGADPQLVEHMDKGGYYNNSINPLLAQ